MAVASAAVGAACRSSFGRLVSRIGTHSGKFHCDDALAVFMLRCLPECRRAHLIRSRDSAELATCDVVVDVGGVYDPATHRYDHHQRQFDESMRSLSGGAKPWSTRLSSAGLVYFHFGRDVIRCVLAQQQDEQQQQQQQLEDEQQLEQLYDQVYVSFVEEVDATDNGISQYSGDSLVPGALPRFLVTSTLSQRVGRLNRSWNAERPADAAADDHSRFETAVALVGAEFVACVRRQHAVWLPARALLQKALQGRCQLGEAGGAVLQLESGAVPWRQHLLQLEQQMQHSGQVQFVIYPDGAQWRVQAVPPVGQPDSFLMRTPLRAEWRGLRDTELCDVTGLSDAVFVHANGFIGGAGSRDSVLKMALMSMDCHDK